MSSSQQIVADESKPHPLLANGILAFFATCFFNGVLTSAKEVLPAFKAVLASIFGHHWFGHGVLVVGFLVLSTLIIHLIKGHQLLKVGDQSAVRYTLLGSVLGVILIIGFYMVHSL